MSTKLIFRNITRSIKDYGIYFITLMLGVSIFYMFNSIYDQQKIMVITNSLNESMMNLKDVLSYISVFVAVLLAFLMIYANRFFIKRRKKEIGLYLLLGFEQSQVSKILIVENLIIGISALCLGLIVGIFGSQFMSILTAKIFEADMKSFTFIFSLSALVKSCIYFIIMFLVVIFFNTFTISKQKLIDLLNAKQKNENIKMQSSLLSGVLLVVSIVFIVIAYYLTLKVGILDLSMESLLSITLGSIGTLLFYFSASRILVALYKKNTKKYFRDINMFNARQINSNIKTNFLTLSIVCINLLLVIVIFSTGYSLQNVLSKEVLRKTEYDYSLGKYFGTGEEAKSIVENLPKEIIKYKGIKDYSEIYIYESQDQTIIYGDFGLDYSKYSKNIKQELVKFIKVSDFNKLLKMQGKKEITLEKNQYALQANDTHYQAVAKDIIDKNVKINLNNIDLVPVNKIHTISTKNYNDVMHIILSDELVKDLSATSSTLLINTYSKKDNEILGSIIEEYYMTEGEGRNENAAFDFYGSKLQIYTQAITKKAIASFLGIYLGFVFMIVCVSILSIQQLSEIEDNKERYCLLQKLGVDESMINCSIFKQILLYFTAPLVLAIVHSVIGIKVANDIVKDLGNVNILLSVIMTTIFILIIYSIYFVITYATSKRIIRREIS
ncbi:MAG: FtsX-like permease family protein [Peptostreptococcaceae bacterium]